MATITITGQASVTVDGKEVKQSASFSADVDSVVERTVEVDTTYITIFTNSQTQNPVFTVITNPGADEALIRLKLIGVTEYVFFGIPALGHLVLPSSSQTAAGDYVRFDALAARAVNSNTRLVVVMGLKA